MTILFTPIDIEINYPAPNTLLSWIDDNKIVDEEWWAIKAERHDWILAASRENNVDWRQTDTIVNWDNDRVYRPELPYVNINPSLTLNGIFPDLEKLLNALPFKQIGVAGFLRQLNEIPLHVDTPDHTNPMEPRRYLVYMTDLQYNTFYLNDGQRDYNITLNDDYRVFAYNNTDIQHGARPPTGLKILLSVVGILDHDKHNELIQRSIAKFPNQVIRSD